MATYTLLQIQQELQGLPKQIRRKAVPAVKKVALDIKRALEENSPVGEKHGGTFKGNWDMKFMGYGAGGMIASAVITNATAYAPPIELGSKVGSPPWPSAGPRTVEKSGRVFSTQAPAGVIAPITKDKDVMQNLVDVINRFVFGNL